MFAAATKDPIDPQIDISFPATSGTELHHIYPREWCRNNRAGDLAEVLNPGDLGSDPCDSVANQMPLSRISNNLWRQRVPAQFIAERGLSFPPNRAIFEPLFIDAAAFASLAEGPNRLRDFWHRRAHLIAEKLTQFMTVHFG
jgi:hypothetical protein